MHWTQLGITAVASLILGFLAGGAGGMAQQSNGERGAEPRIADAHAANALDQEKGDAGPGTPATTSNHEAKADAQPGLENEILSQGQLATLIFRDELRAYGKEDPNGTKLNNLIRWSKAILNDSDHTEAESIAALADHLSRMQILSETVNHLESSPSNRHLSLQAAYFRQEAAQMLARAKAGRTGPAPESSQGMKGSELDPGSQAILKKLEEPIDMRFGDETPLEDVLKFIKSATKDRNGKGIPIYLDPVGLQMAEKTATSPIILDLEGVPLKTTLSLVLAQLGLCYQVKGGVLIVTSPDLEPEEAPLEVLENKAKRGELTADEEAGLTKMLRTLNEVQRLKWEGLKSFRQEGLGQGQDPAKLPGGVGGGFR